jgi:hypothetical protein
MYKLLHVSAAACHHHGVIQNKGVKARHANLAIVSHRRLCLVLCRQVEVSALG